MSFNVAQLFCIATSAARTAVLSKTGSPSEMAHFSKFIQRNIFAFFLIFQNFIDKISKNQNQCNFSANRQYSAQLETP
jgi:hypothetical protein